MEVSLVERRELTARVRTCVRACEGRRERELSRKRLKGSLERWLTHA